MMTLCPKWVQLQHMWLLISPCPKWWLLQQLGLWWHSVQSESHSSTCGCWYRCAQSDDCSSSYPNDDTVSKVSTAPEHPATDISVLNVKIADCRGTSQYQMLQEVLYHPEQKECRSMSIDEQFLWSTLNLLFDFLHDVTLFNGSPSFPLEQNLTEIHYTYTLPYKTFASWQNTKIIIGYIHTAF